MPQNRLVRDAMSKVLISVDPATTVHQVAKMMEQGIGSVLVKRDGKPAGIITDRDYAIKIAVNKMSMDTPVEKVATFPLITIGGDETLKSAGALMTAKKIRKLAVIDNNEVVGIITSSDITAQISI